MEMITEKIEAAALNKTNLIDIFSVGQRVHDIMKECGENCCYSRYFKSQIKNLLENIEGEETTHEEKLNFYELSTRHNKSFLLYDQINKKFGAEISQLLNTHLKAAVFF